MNVGELVKCKVIEEINVSKKYLLSINEILNENLFFFLLKKYIFTQ